MENKAKSQSRSVLGRGLGALISTAPVSLVNRNEAPAVVDAPANSSSNVTGQSAAIVQFPVSLQAAVPTTTAHRFIAIEKIKPNPTQPRQDFSDSEIAELADSIKALGVLQPILVRPSKEFAQTGTYEIVAGERRWRASTKACISELPVIIKEISDLEALEIALVENIQREDLNPIEQALAYQRLMDEHKLSQQEVAERVGKDRVSISNLVRLLKLPEEIVGMVRRGELSSGHAKAILSIKESSAQLRLAKKTIQESLSVRALEALVAQALVLQTGHRVVSSQQVSSAEQDLAAAYNPFPAVIDRMRNVLGTKVIIKHHKSGRGKIEIEYFSEQELDRLVEQICKGS